jgi:(5-formylfuran-3-yl)methyl phosphate synthase
LAGSVETPDVPRLLALKPDFLAVPASQFSILMSARPAEWRAGKKRPPGEDRIFIRDLVLAVRIGAYASERGREQRVRFAVVADLRPRSGMPHAMADIFSYDIVLDTIHTIVAEGHVDLLETLAEDIAQRLLEHQAIQKLTITLEKLDLGPAVAGVEIVRARVSSP